MFRSPAFLIFSPLILSLALVAGCDSTATTPGSYPASNRSDCLPQIALTDQNGAAFSLASLKGKLVLINFVYTSCNGPCSMLTTRFGSIAKQLGGRVGRDVTMVSVSLDPEHDTPDRLAAYAHRLGADRNGWIFVTGTPANVDRVLAGFGLRREREADGSVTHNISSFLVGPDGRQIRQYNGLEVQPDTVAADVARASGRG